MNSKEYVRKKAESSATKSLASLSLQPRAFAVGAQPMGETKQQQVTPELSPQPETAQGFDNLLGGIRVSQRTAIQPKLTIGAPGDKYEKEADAIADTVMNAPENAIASKITPIASGDAMPQPISGQPETLQSKAAEDGSAPEASSSLESQLNQSNAGGSPLPPQVRAFMEPRIGADFGAVRVHADAGAAQLNRQLSAQAFTYGNHIYYGAGRYPSNDALTAHELIHVEQQTGSGGAIALGNIHRQVVQAKTNEPDPWKSAELLDDPELKADDKNAGSHYTDKKDTPLFPQGKPSPEDVRQGALGDCYLQASLASLAAEKPDYITNMMRDNGDGTVTVRLYEVDQTDMRRHKFTPKYIRIEKSTVTHTVESKKTHKVKEVATYNHGALWVDMIEKAYAAGGFTSTGDAAANQTPSYENIEKGVVRYAMEVLLGQQSQYMRLQGSVLYHSDEVGYFERIDVKGFKGEQGTEADFVTTRLPWDKQTVEMYEEVKSKTPNNYSPLGNLKQIFKGTKKMNQKAKIDEWMAFVKSGKIDELFEKAMTKRFKYISSQLTLSDFEQLVDGKSFKDDIMNWLKSQKLFPGELGTAIYSKMQLEEFEKIKKALDNGKSVAANTNTIIREGKGDGTGASGEQIADGLAGGHAYSVLDYRKNASTNPDDENATGKFYWIKLRNPWGRTGRKYKFSENQAEGYAEDSKTNKTGIFWLELSDLTKYFTVVSFG